MASKKSERDIALPKSAKVRTAEWLMEPYGYKICLMIGDTCLEALKSAEFRRYAGSEAKPSLLVGKETSHGLFIEGTATRGLMVFPNKGVTYSVVAHEVFHLVTAVLLRRGVVFSTDSEEVWAYHLAHVLDQALEQLMYWKVPMHNWHQPLTEGGKKS